ncbi:MAG: ADP-ribosylglycohydrolase family protein [Candidatus Atribacteria bacterium]|nr:MAG: ADP-ribosylglycohydrolase family protein [Candidatus Atribacteria bacterium]
MDETAKRNQQIASIWQVEALSGVIVYPLQASVQAMENLGCDMREARGLLPQAEAQYNDKAFGKLVATFARINAIIAKHIPDISAGEPSTWEAYRRTLPNDLPAVETHIDASTYSDRVKGSWLGKCIGTALGDPVEGWTREAIREAHGWIDHYLVAPKTENDDTAYPVLVLHTLDEYGMGFTSEQLGLEWIEHLPSAFTAEQVAMDNIKSGHMPPDSRWPGNPCGAWVGAQMRGEIHGLIAPLSPEVAAQYSFRDATISHYREGLHGEIYAAALISLAFANPPIEDLLRQGLVFVPQDSPFTAVVEQTIESCHRYGEWEGVAKAIERDLARYHWIHTLPNIACVVAGLILGEGDFERTVLTTLACGYDTDCTVGQAAALLGTVLGAERVPAKWRDPIGEALDTYVLGFERIEIDALTAWTTTWGKRIVPDKIV